MTDSRALLQSVRGRSPEDVEEDPITGAAIYARTSSASQEYGYSLDEQVRQCVDRCEMLDWPVEYVFRDEAISGKDTDRPMYQQMLTRAEEGAFDVLVFWKLDRLSRSILHIVQLESDFSDWGVALHSVTEQIDTTTVAGRFNFRNIANAAEFEREMIKQRTKMGHAALAMEHKWPNDDPPIGYELGEDRRLEICEPEAELVREIFLRYLETKSMRLVAEELNERGETTKGGGEWSARRVGDVLETSLYVGQFDIGPVNDFVKECQLLEYEVFEEAVQVRNRFQQCTNVARDKVPWPSRSRRVNQTINLYLEYL